MKIYKTQKEVEKDIKDGVLVVNEDVKFECSISIKASLQINGNINARDIIAGDINARNIIALDINARNIIALDINARNINARDIDAWNIDAGNILYYAFCSVYNDIKCKSIKARREVHQEPVYLDGKLTIREEVKEMTLAEVSEKLDYEVKIIK